MQIPTATRVRQSRPPAHRAATRLLIGGLFCLCLLAPASAQRQPRRTVPSPIDFATSQNDNLFSLVRSQDDIHELETAITELQDGQHDVAVHRLHELLRREATGVVPVAPGRFIGLRNAVVSVLANTSPAGRAAYEELVRREGGDLVARQLQQLSPRQLLAAAERFPSSQRGLAARLQLGDLLLERGDGLGAANHYVMALDATAIASTEERRVAERLACAEALIEPDLARLRSADGEQWPGVDEVLAVLPPTVDVVAAVGGGRSGAMPMTEPVGNPTTGWQQEVQAPGFDLRDKGELAMFPVGDLDGLFVNTGREVIAFDALRGSIDWVSPSPMRDFGEDDWRGRGQYDDTINQDMILAAAVDSDVVVAALQVPDKTVNVDFQASFRIMSKIPQRRLFAFSRHTGKLLWSHFDELDGPRTRRFRGHDACGPPLIAGDTVYAPVQDRSGAIAFSIGAYDLRTGQPKWRRLICSSQQDVNMFGNARMEFAASPLALSGGVLYGAANLGVDYAIDAATGRLRWITAYDVVRMPRAMLRGQADRQVFFANNPPVVVDGVVCTTPLDSQFVLGHDIDSGAILWRLQFDARLGDVENRVQWLCGALDDEFILSGAGTVAVKARPEGTFGTQPEFRQLVRPDQLDNRRRTMLSARPAVTAEHVWIPTRDRLLAFDRAGNERAVAAGIAISGYQPGNLMFVDGIVASLRNRSFDVVLDPQALLARSEARVRDRPDDPAALLRLAGLRRSLLPDDASMAQADAVQDLYHRGLAACIERGLPKSHPTRTALQTELFDQALAVAEAAIQDERPDTLDRLAAARDLAPDDGRWIEVQTLVLSQNRSDRSRFVAELDRLEQFAPSARMPAPLLLPVTAFVLWQRAIAFDDEPPAAIELWQRLLEDYGHEPIGTETGGSIAEAAINRLIDRHGPEVYTKVAQRADQALQAAGSDKNALEALTQRFPNSDAAAKAGMRLLDRAVEQGDLAMACSVFARALRSQSVPPGILRRVQVAAQSRGNQPLAAAMARALANFPDAPSDWQADGNSSFAAAAAAALEPAEPVPASSLELPAEDLLRIPPRTRQEYTQLLPTLHPDGFAPPADRPLYVRADSDLVAFDTGRGDSGSRVLFAKPIDYFEQVLLCGTTLLVPDMERVFAVDYRSGEARWQLEFDQPRMIESLGVTDGVLHVLVQPTIPDGESELLGIEPLTGVTLFRRSLSEQELKPKPIDHQLLIMTTGDDGPAILRLDPVTGQVLATISCAVAVGPGQLELRNDSLATQLYPQGVSGDAQRIYLPIDGRNAAAEPQLVAIQDSGAEAWRWRGSAGAQLLLCQRRGDHFVIAEANEQRGDRILQLDARTGAVQREVDLGYDAAVLNWERSCLDNPAPAIVAIDSLVDRQSRQRQLICFSVGEGPTFSVPLGVDDGAIERTPQFGDGFVTFGVRARRSSAPFRLYAIDLESQKGAFTDERKYRMVETRGAFNGMTANGSSTVLSTTQEILLLGAPRGQ